MKELNSIKSKNDINFTEIVKSLHDHIQNNWNGDMSPKGLSDCEEGDYNLDEIQKSCDEFEGFNDMTHVSQDFPTSVSKYNIKMSEDCGRTPMESLIGAILNHGMVIGRKIKQIETLELFESVSDSIEYEVKSPTDVKSDRITRELEFFKNQVSFD